MTSILVTGGKAPGFPSIIHALNQSNRKYKIFGSDWKPSISAEHLTEKYFVLPDNTSPSFVRNLLDVVDQYNVDVIVPIRTFDLVPICQNLSKFRALGCEPAVASPDPDLIYIALDKFQLLNYIKRILRLDVPEYAMVTNTDELRQFAFDFGYPKKKICIKPPLSNGSRGFRILDEHYKYRHALYNEKPSGIYTTLDQLINVLGYSFPPLLIMEYLPGKEVTLDVLCRKGKTFCVIPRFRDVMRGGITVEGQVLSNNFEYFVNLSEKLIEGFGFSYNIGIQLKQDINQQFQLLEINPRLQGTTSLSVAAGINIPDYMVQMALKQFNYDYNYYSDIEWGTRIERTYQDFYRKPYK